MDPLEVVGNLHKVQPAFQPIISAIRHDVKGYEVLGRFWHENEWKSLGPFFHDSDVPEEFKIEVDQRILELAITEVLQTNKEGLLFINRSAKQLMLDEGEQLLYTLFEASKNGLSLNRIVIELTEHDFEEDFERLSHLLVYYKTYGVQIAIDHVGAKSSNIDRIRQLEPNILKVDTMLIRSQDAQGFQDIMYSLSMLANRIGAALLFENIEDDYQLYFAWKHGGRYYQGYYLAKPSFMLTPDDSLSQHIKTKIAGYIQREKSLVQKRLSLILAWEKQLKELLTKWDGLKKVDRFIEVILNEFHKESFRMFICNSDGLQVSSNFRKRDDHWDVEPSKKGSNWAFRPYFLDNVMQMKLWKKGRLSDIYSDIETKDLIRTFSFPLTDQYFLFIDLDYAYMYEHDFLII